MNKIIKVILHLFYWLVFILFSTTLSYRLPEGFSYLTDNFGSFSYQLLWAIAQFYLFYFIVYKLIENQQYYLYFICSVVIAVFLSLILFYAYQLIFDFRPDNFLIEIMPPAIGTFIIGHTGSLLKGFIRWFDELGKKQELEKMMLKNELDALNAQLNPHFLFNTLNNIDSLIHSRPSEASESLISLSEIMRYMLYRARESKVGLNEEIVHYQNIIKLHELRIDRSATIEFTNNTKNSNIEIAPLLFLPFIENALKFSLFNNNENAIEIQFDCTDKQVSFYCKNLIDKHKTEKNEQGGIGLVNLKKRLEILYPKKHTISTKQNNSYFKAQLTISV